MDECRPDIILLLVDQMRADAIGEATPNINKLALQGVRFDNCYCASPLCSPSRNSIITGRFPGEHGIFGNMAPRPITPELRKDTFASHKKKMGITPLISGNTI